MTAFDRAALSKACCREVVFFKVCESTNSEASALALSGFPAGTLVVADAQEGGKGRMGRRWESPPGDNLYFSLILRPSLPAQRVSLLSLACAVGVAEALNLGIKWPNDVLDKDRRKVAGVLAEMETTAGKVDHVVLGVGINVNQLEFPPDLPEAGSLAALRGQQDRVEVLARCLLAIEGRCRQVETAPSEMLACWRERWLDQGREVRAEGIRGVAIDVAEDGSLSVKTEEGTMSVFAGDVLLVGSPEVATD